MNHRRRRCTERADDTEKGVYSVGELVILPVLGRRVVNHGGATGGGRRAVALLVMPGGAVKKRDERAPGGSQLES